MTLQSQEGKTQFAIPDSVFEAAGVGLALVDFAGRFLRVNPALERLLERREAELVGRALSGVCLPAHARTCFDLIQEVALALSTVQEMELVLESASNQIRWVHLTVSRLAAQTGTPACIVLVVHDSTDYMELQQDARTAARCEEVGANAGFCRRCGDGA